MTKYQLKVQLSYNHGNGYIERESEEFYSSYVAHLLHKFENLKSSYSWDWTLNATVYKIENIRTMTLDEIGLHIHNDDDYIFISSFESKGLLETE